jgi:hypothetical protein
MKFFDHRRKLILLFIKKKNVRYRSMVNEDSFVVITATDEGNRIKEVEKKCR